jgi:hypothetical protein
VETYGLKDVMWVGILTHYDNGRANG